MLGKYIAPSFLVDPITIYDVGYEYDARKPPIGPKTRGHYVIHVILSGKVIFQANPTDAPITVHGGQIYVMYPNDSALFEPLMDEPLEQFFLGFNAENDEIIRYLGLSRNTSAQDFNNVKQVTRAFHKLIDSWNNTNNDKFKFLLNFYNLINVLRIKSSIADTSKSNVKDIFSKAIQYMQENLHRNMTVNELTNHLNIDRSYFSKIFKKQFAMSPYKYYLRLKFLKAQTMLSSTNYTITEISDKLGFADVATFSQAYARFFKRRPTAFRKSIRNKSEP